MDHFAHEHPLFFNEVEEAIPHCCNACGLHVLSSPYYLCAIQDCSFFLHQSCSQLPENFYHYFVRGIRFGVVKKHTLDLLVKPRDDNCRCGDCGKLCKNFTYHCSECEFVLHPQCGSPLDIQIKHISHPQHPMIAMRKEALLLCDVCGRDHKGYFFSCHQCDFWIHQDCALLPILAKVEEHLHHLSLFYSAAALSGLFIRELECIICGEMALKRHSTSSADDVRRYISEFDDAYKSKGDGYTGEQFQGHVGKVSRSFFGLDRWQFCTGINLQRMR